METERMTLSFNQFIMMVLIFAITITSITVFMGGVSSNYATASVDPGLQNIQSHSQNTTDKFSATANKSMELIKTAKISDIWGVITTTVITLPQILWGVIQTIWEMPDYVITLISADAGKYLKIPTFIMGFIITTIVFYFIFKLIAMIYKSNE